MVCRRFRDAPSPGIGHSALVDGVLHHRHQEASPLRLDLRVAVGEHLVEVVTGVDVEHREGDPARPEGLGGQVEQNRRVLAATEEEDGPLRLGGHLADDEDRQRLQEIQVAEGVFNRSDQGGH